MKIPLCERTWTIQQFAVTGTLDLWIGKQDEKGHKMKCHKC